MDRESFIFYGSWHEAIKDLPNDVRLEIYDSIMEYAISGKCTDLKPMASIAFKFIKNDLDRSLSKYSDSVKARSNSGRMGNLKRYNVDLYQLVKTQEMSLEDAEDLAKSRKISQNLAEPRKSRYNENVNENVNENENENDNNAHELSSLSVYESSESVNHSTPEMATYAQQDSKPAYTPPEVVNLSKEKPFDENDWTRLLDIFNEHTGKKLGTVAPMTRERFRALHRDGYTKSEIRKAIIEACKDPWHKERGYKVLTLDFFTKHENIERYQPSEKKPVKANFDWSSIPS